MSSPAHALYQSMQVTQELPQKTLPGDSNLIDDTHLGVSVGSGNNVASASSHYTTPASLSPLHSVVLPSTHRTQQSSKKFLLETICMIKKVIS